MRAFAGLKLFAIVVLAIWGIAVARTDSARANEIRVGQTLPYSGPLSGFGAIGRVQEAYFEKINAEGGINGRKVKFISLDDAYSPPKTVEHTRKLVEQDEVLLMFGSLGTATNNAVHRYLNEKKVPQLFVLSGATKWADPKNFPWTMPGMAAYESEGVVYAKYILKTKPDAKIAILAQNDDFGRDYVAGFKRALGSKSATMIVSEASYETSAPTISSQLAAFDTAFCVDFFEVRFLNAPDRTERRHGAAVGQGLPDTDFICRAVVGASHCNSANGKNDGDKQF